VVGLRLPEDEDGAPPPTRVQIAKRKLGELWTSVAGI
jgi:potassium/hydrogen antiporter